MLNLYANEPYRREEARRLLSDMLSKDVIQRSSSPWASPVVLVGKKDGSIRFCIDYRKVNSITRKDAYPLPRMDDTLDTLTGSKWFSTLDLISGYWQVEIEKKDREKTAFCTSDCLFEFKVMPFGLCNAPATFQRLMDMVLAGLKWTNCLVYIDDIIVIGKTFSEHLTNLTQVLNRVIPYEINQIKKKFQGHILRIGSYSSYKFLCMRYVAMQKKFAQLSTVPEIWPRPFLIPATVASHYHETKVIISP